MNKTWLYYFDVFLVRVRKTIKALLPTFFTSRISKQKFNREKALALTQIFAEPLFPWSSPNIWMEIVGA